MDASKGSNITKIKVTKLGFWGEGETLGENRGGEKMRGEVNNRVGWGVRGEGFKFAGG